MTAQAANSTTVARRLPLRFSLRVLLVAVTAFAIGFPIWYRWPYEEQTVMWAKNSAGEDDLTRPPDMRRVKTWQRQWGGQRLQHGEERYYLGGRLGEVQTYRSGKRHGPFRQFVGKDVSQEGQFRDGKKDGVWRQFGLRGAKELRCEFQNGLLRRATARDRDGKEHVVELQPLLGRPRIVADGIELEDRLARLAAEGRIDDPRIQARLTRPAGVSFANAPLKDVAAFLADAHSIPFAVDPLHIEPARRISSPWEEVPLSIALAVMLTPHDLTCDYRYGCLWITSAEGAENWQDPTGVADIVPPADSQLARSWNEPVKVQAIDKPLAEVLVGPVERLAIAVDSSHIVPMTKEDSRHAVTANLSGIPFKHILGRLLYQTRCRAKLDGETLVILPPE